MQKFQGLEASAVGPVRTTLKNLNGRRAFCPITGHDANCPGLHIVWSFSCTLRFVHVFPSRDPYKNSNIFSNRITPYSFLRVPQYS